MSGTVFTKLQFARAAGVGASCVSNWISRGRLTAPALRPDGRIDGEAAARQLSLTIDIVRQRGQRDRVDRAIAREAGVSHQTVVRARAPNGPVDHKAAERTEASGQRARGRKPTPVQQAELVDLASARRLLEARALDAAVWAERSRRALELERGRFVIAADVETAWATALSGFIADVEGSFADLGLSLGLDRQQMIALKKWWRDCRTRAAAASRKAAAGEPEFVSDPEPSHAVTPPSLEKR